MVKSMTGYGRKVITVDRINISVEVRSVNHRFLDTSFKIPRSLFFMEEKFKKIIQAHFQRGRIELFINLNGEGLIKRDLLVDWDLMDQYIRSLEMIKERYNIEGNVPMEMVTQISDLFSIQESEQTDDTISNVLLDALNEACEQVVNMREIEGEELVKDLVHRIDFIEQTVKKLGERREIVIIDYRDRIKKRIEEYLNEEISNDDSKLYQDIALLAEKGDITEEVTRLNSHTHQFKETLTQEEAIGRKLDFIVQEMHRETNTIGSKSNDVRISEWVVKLKSEIEKIKEQVQNVE